MCDLLKNVQRCEERKHPAKQKTHSDFDDFTVETVENNNDITGVCGGIGSIVPKKKKGVKRIYC